MSHRSLVLFGLVLNVLAFLALPALAQDAVTVELAFLNGEYTDLDRGLQPVERGPLTIHVASPQHRLVVHGNRLSFSALGDGVVDASVEVDFEGEGKIEAVLEVRGIKNRFDDEVKAPRQTVSAAGRARIVGVAEGYLVTVVERTQETAEIQVESGIGKGIVGICKGFGVLLRIDCDGLDRALSVLKAPLPEPGEQFLVRGELLTDEEKAFFDRFVASGEQG